LNVSLYDHQANMYVEQCSNSVPVRFFLTLLFTEWAKEYLILNNGCFSYQL